MRKSALLNREQMEKLPTKRLRAYKNRLNKVREDLRSGLGRDKEPDHRFVTKESPEWQETIATAKELLAEREHVIK